MSTAESRDSNRFQLGRNANPQRVRYKTAIFNEFLGDHKVIQTSVARDHFKLTIPTFAQNRRIRVSRKQAKGHSIYFRESGGFRRLIPRYGDHAENGGSYFGSKR